MKNVIKDLAHKIQQAEPLGRFAIEFWDGEKLTIGDDSDLILRLKSEESARKIVSEGWLGFGEAYMSGDLEFEGDLQELSRLGVVVGFDRTQASVWNRLRFFPRYIKSKNSLKRAVQNISHHYDLGDDFYELYLDKTMTYSCAYFKTDDETLEQAQLNKYEHIARKLMLKSGETLLDVGCGWGGMLIYVAQKYGIKGFGNTLSRNQYEYANRKIQALGLQGQIEVVLQDYRHLTGRFDKFVSIGMFEHVGKEYLGIFMRKTSELLKKAGLGLLHTVGKEAESPNDPWFMRYIFPGMYIPNLAEICFHTGQAGLSILDVENLRLHYAKTVEHWARNFEANIEKVRERFGEVFARMWRLYLNGPPASFKHGESRLYQILFSNGLNNQLPMTREYCYSASTLQ